MEDEGVARSRNRRQAEDWRMTTKAGLEEMGGMVEVGPDPEQVLDGFILQRGLSSQNAKVQGKMKKIVAFLGHSDELSPFIKFGRSVHLLRLAAGRSTDEEYKSKY
ncbi:hypothetical protein DPX16_2887 [Anabarilius grahami]|uniref:Uncharacterized protein n=1 Tax=Anabarilius grahami TaxID=495550 RepID=A0A3N0XI86_ANAGA|nr:hypothetical protein DPX16_2887 [Anabarilius grahami]